MGDGLEEKLYEAWSLEVQRSTGVFPPRWTSLQPSHQAAWDAAARVARELVRGNVLGVQQRAVQAMAGTIQPDVLGAMLALIAGSR
jgi:hypothetical protein